MNSRISVKVDLAIVPCATATTVKVLIRINNRGSETITAIIRNGGKEPEGDLSVGLSKSKGGSRWIFFEIYFPQTGPAIIAVGKPRIIPNRITHPSCALIMSATATGPGVGGMKLCVTASPARSGIA